MLASVERGFFAPPEHVTPPGTRAGGAKLGLARYQRLMPDGRLFEYPVGEEGSPLADDDIEPDLDAEELARLRAELLRTRDDVSERSRERSREALAELP